MTLDPTSFTTSRELLGLYAHMGTHKRAQARGALRVYRARAITDSVPLNLKNLASGHVESGKTDKISRYILRAKIIGHVYNYRDPHSLLPDPCAAKDAAEEIAIAKLYTLCVTPKSFDLGDFVQINKGDIIEISCKIDPSGKPRTDYAVAKRIISRSKPWNWRTDANLCDKEKYGKLEFATTSMSHFMSEEALHEWGDGDKKAPVRFPTGPDPEDPALGSIGTVGAVQYGRVRKKEEITTVVLHSTEGHSRESTISTFANAETAKSAHYVVGKDGVITQMVPENVLAWHAGNFDVNTHSVGIEIVGFAHGCPDCSQPDQWNDPARSAQIEAVKLLVADIVIRNEIVPSIATHDMYGMGSGGTVIRHLDVPGKGSTTNGKYKFWGGSGIYNSKRRSPCYTESTYGLDGIGSADFAYEAPGKHANQQVLKGKGCMGKDGILYSCARSHSDPGPTYPYTALMNYVVKAYMDFKSAATPSPE